MDVNVFRFSNRALVVNKSDDQLVGAKIVCALEEHGLLTSVFDILSKIPPNEYYINLFRYHSGLKQLANTIIAKPRKAPPEQLQLLDKYRAILFEFLSVASMVHKPLSCGVLLEALASTEKLLKLSNEGLAQNNINEPLQLLADKGAQYHFNTLLLSINRVNLFNDSLDTHSNQGRQEFDLSLFVHCDIPVFLYSPPHKKSPSLLDRLLVNYLKTALKGDTYKPDTRKQKKVDALCHTIRNFNVVTLKHNTKPQLSGLSVLMA